MKLFLVICAKKWRDCFKGIGQNEKSVIICSLSCCSKPIRV